MNDKSEITIYSGSSLDKGSCNACRRYMTKEGNVEHRIYVIVLKTTEVKLCEICFDILLGIIRQREKEKRHQEDREIAKIMNGVI